MKNTLSRLRKLKGLTQQEVADAIGIARNTYTQYELARRAPDYETIKKLASFHNVSVDYLLGGATPQSVELLDLFTKEDVELFVGDYSLSMQQRASLLEMTRVFVEAMKSGEKRNSLK